MLVYVQILHTGPLHSAPRLSPLELRFSEVRAGTHRRAQAAGGGGVGGCAVLRWHFMLTQCCTHSILLFCGMRLEGPCLVGKLQSWWEAKHRGNTDTAHLSCHCGWLGPDVLPPQRTLLLACEVVWLVSLYPEPSHLPPHMPICSRHTFPTAAEHKSCPLPIPSWVHRGQMSPLGTTTSSVSDEVPRPLDITRAIT